VGDGWVRRRVINGNAPNRFLRDVAVVKTDPDLLERLPPFVVVLFQHLAIVFQAAMLLSGTLGSLARGLFEIPLARQKIAAIEKRSFDLDDPEPFIAISAGKEREQAWVHIRKVNRLVGRIYTNNGCKLGDPLGRSAVEPSIRFAELSHSKG